ncbi:MAG: 30S ribosomal protein S10 [Nitrososphaeria archaeon]|nr:30S ribosomal protein S10 [Nitrososphaeria archaeon]
MTKKAKIILTSTNVKLLEDVCNQIKEITEKTGVKMKGPVPLPTKKRKVVTRKSPCGEGTHTFDKWELRIHRRYVEIDQDERTLRQFMRLKMPEEVQLRVSLT